VLIGKWEDGRVGLLLLISVGEIAGDVEEEGKRKTRVVLVPLAPAGGNNE
jgi:hypothetical protein